MKTQLDVQNVVEKANLLDKMLFIFIGYQLEQNFKNAKNPFLLDPNTKPRQAGKSSIYK